MFAWLAQNTRRREKMKIGISQLALVFALSGGQATAADIHADFIVRNAEILTMDPAQPRAKALAIKGRHIMAVGGDAQVGPWHGPRTQVLDVAGKTVIPGLIDSHIHAIRGGQTYQFETYWYGVTTLHQALERLGRDAGRRPEGRWAAVVGSWHPAQFTEGRAPTVAELSAIAPNHPVYVQYLYDYALVNARGIEALRLDSAQPHIAPGITIERDEQERATGKLYGGVGAFNALFARLVGGNDPDASLLAFLAELNARGVTGIVDPNAGPPETYEPLFRLHEQRKLTVRIGYRVSALPSPDAAAWFRQLLAFRPPRHDDGWLAFLGIGENLVTAMNDGVRMGPGFAPDSAARRQLADVALLAAQRGVPLEIHAYTDDAANAILDVLEPVGREYDLRPLRWAIAHLNTASARTLQRVRDAGLAYTVQMGPYFEAPAILRANNADVARSTPPTRLALDLGIMVAGGTDATRIGLPGVWQAIAYQIHGRSLGNVQRRPALNLSREEALQLYTANAAWLAFAEHERGTLRPGMLADLAVLDQPYLSVEPERIASIRSVLTIVDGKIVHTVGDGALTPGVVSSAAEP
ncbi:amidohydrolase [Achromobacter pestifer]